MPDERKSNQKSDSKEQRKSRRRHAPHVEKKENNQQTPVNKEPGIPQVPEKPVHEPPGPEFFKSLKRETDEILKITEEANSKYKKKEIQSNWAKYEMPIDSYNDIEEQENLGADYEALIQAPLSVGGHFQFKHEKSWDISTGPSIYDKYFEIDMDKLGVALSTIPFYERNFLDQSMFTESDILNMNNRATKFKQKYYNDKKYTTPELEAQEIILRELTKTGENPSVLEMKENTESTKEINFIKESNNSTNATEKIKELQEYTPDQCLDSKISPEAVTTNEIKANEPIKVNIKFIENKENVLNVQKKQENVKFVDDIDDIINIVESKTIKTDIEPKTKSPIENVNVQQQVVKEAVESPVKIKETPKNPVIESPEDLEKWLDDFLDD